MPKIKYKNALPSHAIAQQKIRGRRRGRSEAWTRAARRARGRFRARFPRGKRDEVKTRWTLDGKGNLAYIDRDLNAALAIQLLGKCALYGYGRPILFSRLGQDLVKRERKRKAREDEDDDDMGTQQPLDGVDDEVDLGGEGGMGVGGGPHGTTTTPLGGHDGGGIATTPLGGHDGGAAT